MIIVFYYSTNALNCSTNAICYASEFGYFEMAKWLILLGNELLSPIDIHAGDEHAFTSACRYGHLEIAKWLLLLGNELSYPINIHIGYGYAFTGACTNNHLEVAKWLCSICDKYNVDFINGKIEYEIKN